MCACAGAALQASLLHHAKELFGPDQPVPPAAAREEVCLKCMSSCMLADMLEPQQLAVSKQPARDCFLRVVLLECSLASPAV